VTTPEALASRRFETSLGPLAVVVSARGVVIVRFVGTLSRAELVDRLASETDAPVVEDDLPLARRAERQLQAFLAGRRRAFSLPLDLRGTPFQRRVWDALSHIPYGETRSYARLAEIIGRPGSARAVASACAKNPAPILVPCHRVVTADGAVSGYIGGVTAKRQLLALERGGAGAALPLFAVAAARDEAARRASTLSDLLARLGPELGSWLRARLERDPTLARSWLDPEAWVGQALDTLTTGEVATLAEDLARHPQAGAGTVLRSVAAELVAAVAAATAGSWPAPETAAAVLRASALLDSPALVSIGLELASRPRPPGALLDALDEVYREVLAGTLPCPASLRERAVDLWLGLQARRPASSWSVLSAQDPSAVYARAGLWQEAALAAEDALAAGTGDRRALLLRLADAYEALGDAGRARERLLSLLAERDDLAVHERLRRLDDHLEAAWAHERED
jgi:O-6-methylguanine DNA methyltransferase